MTATRTCPWKTSRNRTYVHHIIPFTGHLPSEPGNYLLAMETPAGWIPLYMDDTADLQDVQKRTLADSAYTCALQGGATHIHYYINHDGAESRHTLRRDLVNRYRPACNRTQAQ